MTIAALTAMALGELLGLAHSYWAVLTAVIITQASVGGSIKASVDRMIGTISGGLFGGLVAVSVPHDDPVGGLVALAIALAPLAVLSASSASFRVAPITAIILLLTPQQAGVWQSAGARVAEIGFGNIVGLVCSLVILPDRAHRLTAEAAASLARLYAELIGLLLHAPGAAASAIAVQAVQARVRGALSRLETVIGDAGHERRTSFTAQLDPEPLLRNLLRLRHDLVMLGRAASTPLPTGEITLRLQPRLDEVAEAVADFFRDAASALTGEGPPPKLTTAHAALAAVSETVDAVRSEGLARSLDGDAVERLFTMGFALDQLGRDLDELSARAAERARPPGA
jgi:uncharacterized membrane protein YccC